MNVWQIATGETGRDYREVFSDHDVMIIGPSYFDDALLNNYHDGISNSAGCQVHNFAHAPRPGDRVLMRFAKEVIGVGQIPVGEEQYSFNNAFRCVYGWDLCHCRRVIWAENYELNLLSNVYDKVKQKPSFTKVHEDHILKTVRGISSDYFDRPLKELPQIDASIYTEEELGVELFRAGISNKNIEDILKALQQAERLCSWYWSNACGRSPSEFEIIAHIIIPLFLGLGWSHQQIAVEWGKIDVAFFKITPTVTDNCIMLLEAKGLGKPLSNVLSQPIKYVNDHNLLNAKCILITDGANLFVYRKENGSWSSNPIGYMNITSLQKEYILPKNISLVDTLVKLQPSIL